MPGLKARMLQRLLQAAKEAYQKEVKAGSKSLFRWEYNPKQLLTEGMKEPLSMSPVGEPWKPTGLYFSPKVKDLPQLITGSTIPGTRKGLARYLKEAKQPHPIVRGTLDTKRVWHVEEVELLKAHHAWVQENYPGVPRTDWNDKVKVAWQKFLAKSYDAVWVKNVDTVPGREEVISLNPKTTKLFWKGLKWPFIIGASTLGAMGLDTFRPEEAEAGIVSKMIPGAGKAAKKLAQIGAERGESSTAGNLIGKEFNGKVIKDVVQGKGRWRTIMFEDGNMQAVTKDVLHDIMRAFGTTKYTKAFMEKLAADNKEAALTQALKSLEYHAARSQHMSRDQMRDFFKSYKLNVQQTAGPDAVPSLAAVEFEGEYFLMPRIYAESLQKEGYIKIVEGTAERALFKRKPYKPKAKTMWRLHKIRGPAPNYDFGGAEYPYKKGYTIVDTLPQKEYKGYIKDFPDDYFKTPYVEQDVFKPFKLRPGKTINVSRVMRYDESHLEKIVDNVDRNLASGGRVRLFDYEDVIAKVLPIFKRKGFKVIKKEMVNPGGKDATDEWLVWLKRR